MTDWEVHTVWVEAGGDRLSTLTSECIQTLTTRTKGALDVWKSQGLYDMGSIQEKHTHTHSRVWQSALPGIYSHGVKVNGFSRAHPWLFIFSFSPLLQSQTARCGSSSFWLARSGPQGGAFRNPGSRASGEPGPERSKVTARLNRGQTGSQPAPIGADSASQPPRSRSVHSSVFRWLKLGVQPAVNAKGTFMCSSVAPGSASGGWALFWSVVCSQVKMWKTSRGKFSLHSSVSYMFLGRNKSGCMSSCFG